MTPLSLNTLLKTGVLAVALCAGPVLAQSADEDITVTGRFGSDTSAQSLSQAVSYADLDLTVKADRDLLRQRVSLTARYLCDRLGESDSSSPLVPSCRDAAVKDAMARVGTVEQGFAPRGTKWTRPARWHAPYPDDWATRYP
ncbi:MAG: UrcA family protein [Sphingomonadales bacterium]|nr:UrcA family protein [Sphingomonadales bacterium]